MIPKQLQNSEFRFCLIRKQSKAPYEKEWQKKGYKFDDPKLLEHLKQGGNYGVIGGYGNLRILDKDSDDLKINLNTFCVETGGGGKHFYLISDYDTNHVFANELGELRANNYQVVGASSTHPNGKQYKVLKDRPIAHYSEKDLLKIIKQYLREEQETTQTTPTDKKDTSGSGLEYRRVLAMIREGKTRETIYKEMLHYRKWASTKDDYRNTTYNKAMDFHLKSMEKDKDIPVTKESLGILKDKNLFENINKEFEKQITGEEKSRKAIFLSLCSIWVKNTQIPLNLLVSSESSAGKSFVCKKIIGIFPKALTVCRTKITGEAFTYWHTNEDNWTWEGKICYLEDVKQDLLDSATFKVMCSEGSVATIVRNQKAIDLHVNGKPCMLVTTAGTTPNTEILNRFSIVQLDESSNQTKNITLNQAMELKEEEYNKNIVDSLISLKRISVSVPFAPQIHNFITKNYSWNDVRMRRDFSRLRDLIKCSVALHQFQRKEEDGKFIATKEDYEIARECINYIQTTTLKGLTHKLKKAYSFCIKEQEFTAKDIHSKYPFVSQQMWYKYLDDLCERGLLTTELRKREGSDKRVTYYLVPDQTSFDLPKYDKLEEYSVI